MSNTDLSTVTVTTSTYSRLDNEAHSALLATVPRTDRVAKMDMLDLLDSHDEVSDEHALILGWVREFILTIVGADDEVVVQRPKRRGGFGSLDSFMASLNGAGSGISPDDVVSVCDDQGDEVYVSVGRGDDKREIKLVDNRGTVSHALIAQLDDGTTHVCENGKRISFADVGGSENWFRVTGFSRDSGETFHAVEWTMRLPRV